MRKISSDAVPVLKRYAPLALVGLFLSSIAVSPPRPGAPETGWLVAVSLAVTGFVYLLLRRLLFSLVDEVWDTGDALLVKNRGSEELVPYAAIRRMSYAQFARPQRARIELHAAGRFGSEIAFYPVGGYGRYRPDPVLEELIARIAANAASRV